jgi:hypothetical protein
LGRQVSKCHKLLERKGERRHVEISPHGASTPRMLGLKMSDLFPCTLGRQDFEVTKDVAKLMLSDLVVLWPCIRLGIFSQQELPPRTRFPKLIRDSGVSRRGFGEPLPHLGPPSLTLPEHARGRNFAFEEWVKSEVRCALPQKCVPFDLVNSQAKIRWIVQPSKEASYRIGIDEVVEEVGVENCVLQPVHALAHQPIKSKLKGTDRV